MQARKLLATLVLILMLLGAAYASPTWINLGRGNGTSPNLTLSNDTSDSIVYTVVIPGFYKEDVTENNTTYQKIWFPTETALEDSGYPELPTILRLIAIPSCDSVMVQVTIYSQLNLSDYLVYPAPKYVPGEMAPSFCKNDSVYATSAYYPGQYKSCSAIDHFRDQDLVNLIVQPVWFSPDSQKIRIYDSLQVKLTFNNPLGAVNRDVGIFNSAAQSMFLNYDIPSTSPGGETDATWGWYMPAQLPGVSCDYLIITAGFVYDNYTCRLKIQQLAAAAPPLMHASPLRAETCHPRFSIFPPF